MAERILRRYPSRRLSRDANRPPDPVSPAVRAHVKARDGVCVFTRLAIPHECFGPLELDHVRASGGLGGPREAALAVELLGVDAVAPIHYGTFPILAGTPEQLRVELDAPGLGPVALYGWVPGESLRG